MPIHHQFVKAVLSPKIRSNTHAGVAHRRAHRHEEPETPKNPANTETPENPENPMPRQPARHQASATQYAVFWIWIATILAGLTATIAIALAGR